MKTDLSAALRRLASANDVSPFEAGSSFVRNVTALLDRAEYRRCDKGEDLEELYRLRYKSYRLSDLLPESSQATIHDALDETPNCFKFGVFLDGQLASTIRIHHISREERRSPSAVVYGDLIDPMLDQPAAGRGVSFIDPSRFAVEPEFSRLYPQIPYLTLRLAGMACFHFDAPYCLATVREEHAGFYRRVFCSKPFGERRAFPKLNCDGVCYIADVEEIRTRSLVRYPFFKSTASEQRMLFDQPSLGEGAPLTVLPTARYFREAA